MSAYCVDCPLKASGATALRARCCQEENDAVVGVLASPFLFPDAPRPKAFPPVTYEMLEDIEYAPPRSEFGEAVDKFAAALQGPKLAANRASKRREKALARRKSS